MLASAAPAQEDPTQLAEAASFATLLETLRSEPLRVEQAVSADDLRLAAGSAVFEVDHGVLFPAPAIAERPTEFVFLGKATLVVEPPDAIEAHQLAVFTGSRRLERRIESAVLAITLDQAVDAILRRPTAAPSPRQQETARRWLAQWRDSTERRTLQVDTALIADQLGDATIEGFFAGWFEDDADRFLYRVDPRDHEQVQLGRFVPLELTEREERQISRMIRRGQRRGRWMDAEVDRLGEFDVWMAHSLRRNEQPVPGAAAFEARHYRFEVTIESKTELSASGAIEIEALPNAGRFVTIHLDSDLRIQSLRHRGRDIAFYQELATTTAILPAPPAAGERLVLEVEWAGKAFEKSEAGGDRSYLLSSTIAWHPHVGRRDLATYDVTYIYPRRWQLVAAGTLVDHGSRGRADFQQRRIDRPTHGVSFQFDRFLTFERRVGHIDVTLAIDSFSRGILQGETLLDWIEGAIVFLEATWGELATDHLEIVTAPQFFSQALDSYVTLSTFMIMDDRSLALEGFEDPQSVVAHELAHLWWGHSIAWDGYRDQWLSEALAEYSANLYLRREHPERLGIWSRPGDHWVAASRDTIDNGMRVEELGPVVIGNRLGGSFSEDAYQTIVYTRGALVMDHLSRLIGEDGFTRTLRFISTESGLLELSTAAFIDILERATGLDLAAFAESMVYGTHTPRVDYRWRKEQRDDGWHLVGEHWLTESLRQKVAVVPLPGRQGVFDVRSVLVADSAPPDGLEIALPMEIGVFNPQLTGGKKRKRLARRDRQSDGPALANHLHRGVMRVKKEPTTFDIRLSNEPLSFELNPRDAGLAHTYDLNDQSRRGHLWAYRRAEAAGDHEAARERLRALATTGVENREHLQDFFVVHAALLEAQFDMNLGHLDAAAQKIAAAERGYKKLERNERDAFAERMLVARARLRLLEGKWKQTLELLREFVVDDELWESPMAPLLLAEAARRSGDSSVFRQAIGQVEDRHGDTLDLWRLVSEEAP